MGIPVEGIVQEEDAGTYLCQDLIEGGVAEDRHGYRFSYYVENASEQDLRKYFVREFKLKK